MPASRLWAEALELIEHADRLQRQFFRLGHHRHSCPTWEPPIDMLETEQQLGVLVALPGVSSEHLTIALEGHVLVVRGQRPMPELLAGATIRRLEIPFGRFERRIELPALRYRLGQPALQYGCLALVLDKLGPAA